MSRKIERNSTRVIILCNYISLYSLTPNRSASRRFIFLASSIVTFSFSTIFLSAEKAMKYWISAISMGDGLSG